MLTITIKTDNPQAELELFETTKRIGYLHWQAHRELAETIHLKIKQLLDEHGFTYKDLEAIVAYQGPGSFTGLRIGLSVANALAVGLQITVVGTTGEDWQHQGMNKIASGENSLAMPEYGALPNITKPKH